MTKESDRKKARAKIGKDRMAARKRKEEERDRRKAELLKDDETKDDKR